MQDLKTLREGLGFSCHDIAIAAELTPLTISNIELKRTLPQADCRVRLELVLGSRINWLLTTGLKSSDNPGWENIEANFRKVFYQVGAMPKKEQAEFIEIAKIYLETFIELINTSESSIRLPKALKANRKHTNNLKNGGIKNGQD
jgi:hypothetical protein